jgi:ubiquinone/menaquinone biosynthesis C-methylase UbiE
MINSNHLCYYRAHGTNFKLELQNNILVSVDSQKFTIKNGVPDLVWPPDLSNQERLTRNAYDQMAEHIYDAALEWQFAVLYENEQNVREGMIDQLKLEPHHKVLEVGCGNGRDSFRIARRLGPKGALFMQDLSSVMVHECLRKMTNEYVPQHNLECVLDYSVSNAVHLPFADNSFDRVFHFGGFNEFSDHERGAAEFGRVVKPGGLVVFGDEAVGPWLKDKEFGRIVIANNPLFAHNVPLGVLPDFARNVCVRWIMGNCFYVISFVKGDGPPPLNMNLPHKGRRGGTLSSRYYGIMEGVTPDTKELANKAASRQGISVHEWLESNIKAAAKLILLNSKDENEL